MKNKFFKPIWVGYEYLHGGKREKGLSKSFLYFTLRKLFVYAFYAHMGDNMSINYAILGILSYKSMTGYDLKKVIQESSFMHWSGNNNQIYKALVELLDEGYVTNEVFHQDSSPTKKIYTITEKGLVALKEWVLSDTEAPEFKKTFLIQLAWADQLNSKELNALLTDYENKIKVQILMQQEKKKRKNFSPDRTTKEVYLWDMIHDNIISSYTSELEWVNKLRKELCKEIKRY